MRTRFRPGRSNSWTARRSCSLTAGGGRTRRRRARRSCTSRSGGWQAGEDYDYDDNGNRTGGGYLTGQGNRLLCDGTYTYQYDAEGNRTARFVDVDLDGQLSAGDTDVTAYAWDYRNRLVEVTERAVQGGAAAQVVAYTYDASDRRIQRTLDSDGDGTPEDYRYQVHRGGEAALELSDPDGLEGQTYEPALAHRYLYGAAVDQILAVEDDSGDVLWGLADHQGTIRDVIDSAASLVQHRKYDSFGNADVTPIADFLFAYTGRPLNVETGLYDYRARWYDAGVGRFVSEDPLGFAAGDMNSYRYVGNSPLDYTDPTGMSSFSGVLTKKIELGPPIHLSLDQLQTADESLRLPIAPG